MAPTGSPPNSSSLSSSGVAPVEVDCCFEERLNKLPKNPLPFPLALAPDEELNDFDLLFFPLGCCLGMPFMQTCLR